MKTKEKLVPELRFPEFTDEWEEKKLGEMVELITKGTTPGKYIDDGEINFLRIENIEENFVCKRNIKKIRLEEHNSRLKRSILKENDILFSIAGALGKTLIVRKNILPANTNQALAIIRLDNPTSYLVEYIYRQLNSSRIQNYIKAVSTVGAQPNLSLKQVSEFVIFLPSNLEQQKIGNFFSKIDEKLELQRKRIEELKTYKKGMMQRIFNQEIRFKDEKGNEYPEWEEKRLGEISKVKKGDQLNRSNFIENGKYYVLNGGKELSGWTNNWNTQANTISISEGGESCGFVNYNTEKFWSGGHLYTLEKLKENINNIYLYQYLKQKEKLIMRLRVGSGLPNIQIKDIRNFKIQLPSLSEQEKIANFLSAIDKKIELEEEKLKEFEEFKKGLMQRMFI